MDDLPAIEVTDNVAKQRYEAVIDDELVGILDYVQAGESRVFPHAEVKEEWGGQGVATEMTRQALDMAIKDGHRIVPRCPFVVDFLRHNPEYREHVA